MLGVIDPIKIREEVLLSNYGSLRNGRVSVLCGPKGPSQTQLLARPAHCTFVLTDNIRALR